MTLREFIDKLAIDIYHFDKIHTSTLDYELLIEHDKEFVNINHGKTTKANVIDIDNNEKTITLKYKYKG